jgi:histidine triad (HIT) family protein
MANTRAAACVFCNIIAGYRDATVIETWDDAIAFIPLDPCTPGHTLVVPLQHVERAGVTAAVTGMAFARADELANRLAVKSISWGERWAFTDFHLAVNAGPDAGMTVPHLHVHIVPRRPGDGLAMPWTAQQTAARHAAGVAAVGGAW